MRNPDCPFCGYTESMPDGQVMQIEPFNPVTPGHVLFIPTEHVEHAYADPNITARLVFAATAFMRDLGAPNANMILNVGSLAGQTVFHLHLHFVPRRANDGLVMPWGTVHSSEPAAISPDRGSGR